MTDDNGSTALAKRDLEWLLHPNSLERAMEIAGKFAESDMVPDHYKRKPANCLLAIMRGLEIGLSPAHALESIAVINGRTTLWGDTMLALVVAHPKCAGVHEEIVRHAEDGTPLPVDEWHGRVEVHRVGWAKPIVRTFSVADAKRAGLWEKPGPWKNYPARMLQLRARSFALRDAFSDALRGMAMGEEMQDTLPPTRVEGRRVDDDGLEEAVRRYEADMTPRATDGPAGGADYLVPPGADPDAPHGVINAAAAEEKIVNTIVADDPDELRPEYDFRGGVRGKYSDAKLDNLVDKVRVAHSPEPEQSATVIPGGTVKFEFGGKEFTTMGVTREQMTSLFKLCIQAKNKARWREMLMRDFGHEHRAQLTEAEAGAFITALQGPA